MEDDSFLLDKNLLGIEGHNVMVCRRQSFFFTFPGFLFSLDS